MALDVERVMDGAGLAASALPIAPARADEAVELVLWSWLPDFQAPVDLFQAAHPSIKVKLVNAGQVRSFRQLNALADVGEWANPHKGEFAEWCWNQVSDGGKVYSMPSRTAAPSSCFIARISLRNTTSPSPRLGTSLPSRLGFFIPYAVPTVIAALIWGYIYGPVFGPFSQLSKWTGLPPPDFLSDQTMLFSLANIVTWEYTGYNMIIYYAALKGIPLELREVAEIDGASPRQYA